MIKSYLFFVLIAFINYSCTDSILESDNVYPTILPSLSDSDLEKLQDEFNRINDFKINAKLNRFGFIGNDIAVAFPSYPAKELSSDSVLEIVKKVLIENKKFTNVNNETDFLAGDIEIRNIYNNTQWVVQLKNQKYKNLVVYQTNIAVYIYGDQVHSIFNSWYPNAYIPLQERISSLEAKTTTIGYEIRFWPNGVMVIKEKDIGEINTKKIIPLVKENILELRVAWQIPIKFGETTIGWYLYMDVFSGEIIATEQNIIFN